MKRSAEHCFKYQEETKALIKQKQDAKNNGSIYVESSPKIAFVMRIHGIVGLAPKPRKILRLLRLKQVHNGVFVKVNKPIMNMLKIVNPFVTYGYPSLKAVKDLIYKRGCVKFNNQRIRIQDNEIINNKLGE